LRDEFFEQVLQLIDEVLLMGPSIDGWSFWMGLSIDGWFFWTGLSIEGWTFCVAERSVQIQRKKKPWNALYVA
jgi:hypothetical protein